MRTAIHGVCDGEEPRGRLWGWRGSGPVEYPNVVSVVLVHASRSSLLPYTTLFRSCDFHLQWADRASQWSAVEFPGVCGQRMHHAREQRCEQSGGGDLWAMRTAPV